MRGMLRGEVVAEMPKRGELPVAVLELAIGVLSSSASTDRPPGVGARFSGEVARA